jgi:hypothetical protein
VNAVSSGGHSFARPRPRLEVLQRCNIIVLEVRSFEVSHDNKQHVSALFFLLSLAAPASSWLVPTLSA